MEVIGRIKNIGQVQEFGENGFRKREVVVVTQEQYPQPIMIEFTQMNCELLDNFFVGDEVIVGINIRGREYMKDGVTKYFNVIQGWRISKKVEVDNNVVSQNQNIPQPINAGQNGSSPFGGDDIPF